MIPTALALGALLGLLLSAFVSAVETGSYVLNRVRLRVRVGQNDPAAQRLSTLLERHEELLLMTLLGNTLADYVCTACLTALLLYAALGESLAEIYATAIVTPALLVLGGIIPKDWFRRDADQYMYPLALPLVFGLTIARKTGFIWLLRSLTRVLLRRIPGGSEPQLESAPRTRMLRLLHEGAAAGGLSTFQRDLMDRILNLARVRVSGVMIPRSRAAIASLQVARTDFLRMARMCHFSRIPVHGDDPRRLVGVISVFDVLTDDVDRPIASYVRPLLVLQSEDVVPAALLKMQQTRNTMAVVTDRAGQAVGILTMKDLVEEIVGDLDVW